MAASLLLRNAIIVATKPPSVASILTPFGSSNVLTARATTAAPALAASTVDFAAWPVALAASPTVSPTFFVASCVQYCGSRSSATTATRSQGQYRDSQDRLSATAAPPAETAAAPYAPAASAARPAAAPVAPAARPAAAPTASAARPAAPVRLDRKAIGLAKPSALVMRLSRADLRKSP